MSILVVYLDKIIIYVLILYFPANKSSKYVIRSTDENKSGFSSLMTRILFVVLSTILLFLHFDEGEHFLPSLNLVDALFL